MGSNNHTSLQSLLSSRAILSPSPDDGPTISDLAAAALKLINQSQDFSSLVEEVDWEKEQSSRELVHLVSEQIRFKPSFKSFSESEVLENLIIQTGKKYILAADKEGIERLAKLAVKLKEEGIVKLIDVGKEILSSKALVTDAKISWFLAWSGLAPLDTQFLQWSKTTATQFSLYISDLVNYSSTRTEVGEGLLEASVNDAYGEVLGRQQRAQMVLKKLVMKLLDTIYQGEQPELQWVRLNDLDKTRTSRWGMVGLTIMLQHRPSVKVGEAIKYQADWKVTSNTGLGSLCSGLLQTQDNCQELVCLVGRVVRRVEVNWKAVLAILTISIEQMPESDKHWHSLISDMVRTGLNESDQEAFLSGLLLARQASLAGTPCFPSYSSWFQSNFGDEQTSLAAHKRSYEFLISQLTSLVPWEPAYTMKVHITRSPGVPRKLKELLDEYKSLIRTQLSVLGELSNDVDISNNTVSDETFNQVKKFLEEYSTSGKIPPSMMEIEMFRKPFFTSQVVPALLLVKISDEMEVSRGDLVELLYNKGKIPGPLYRSFVSGELRYNTAAPETKVADDDCTEESLFSRLGLLSHLDTEEDIRLVLGQVGYILRTLLTNTTGGDDQLSLSSVLNADQDKLPASLHCKILEVYLIPGPCRTEMLPLLTACLHMLRQTLYWILTATVFHPAMVDIIVYLRDTGRSNIKVKNSNMCVVDMLGSTYQPVYMYEQLGVLESVLKRLSQYDSCPRRKVMLNHLVNRRLCLAREDLHLSWSQLSVEDFRNILEMEANIESKVDKLDQIQKIQLLFAIVEQCDIPNLDLSSCLLTTLVDIWEYTGKLSTNALIMVQAVSKVVGRDVWLELWRQKMKTTITEKMLTVFELIPGMVLECVDDVKPLIKTREPNLFCLTLPLVRLILSSKLSTDEYPILGYSIGYWAARGCVKPPPSPTMDIQVFLTWRDDKVDDAGSARVGLVFLAEDYLRGLDTIFDTDRPVIRKLKQISETAGQEAVESVLTDNPDVWFPSGMSPMMSSSISLVMIMLCTTKAVFHPSVQFCIGTLLPRLSHLMEEETGDLTDWEVGYVNTSLVKKIQEYREVMIKKELDKLEVHLHADLEEILSQYFKY